MSAMVDQRSNVSELRVPPHDVGAERSVLGSLMFDPSAISRIADWVVEDDFYRSEHRVIFRAVTSLVQRGAPVDPVTMMDWFDANGLKETIGGSGTIAELASESFSAANIVAYAEIVVQHSRLRRLIDQGSQLAEAAWKRSADPERLASDAVRSLSEMRASKLRGALEPVSKGMRDFMAELNERYSRGPGLLGQPWPWEEVNACTKGIRDGTLIIVGARPSMGKSVFGLQVATNSALNGKRTALFTVEMTAAECMSRAVAQVGRVPHDFIEQPSRDDFECEEHWSKISRATERLLAAPLLIDETPGLTRAQLSARARRAHLQSPLQLIVIDHLHDMGLDPKGEMRHELGRVVQEAKTLAKEFNCPVILLAQLNRKSADREQKRPTMTDLRESGEIEQKADVIFFLHREDYYDKKSHMQGVIELIPAKGRNLRLGETIYLRNRFDQMRIDDWQGPLPEAPAPEAKSYKQGRNDL